MGASAIVHSYGQGSISGNSNVTVTHNLGYNPLFAVRWSDSGDISGGVATKAYSPNQAESYFVTYDEEEVDEALSTLLALIEPAMITFLGVIIGFIVIAMYLPVFEMAGSIS